MKVWRVLARRRLVIELGGACVGCGVQECDEKMTFDHKEPLTEEEDRRRAKMGMHSRLVLYRREAKEKKIQLLCQSCQNKKQKRFQNNCPF